MSVKHIQPDWFSIPDACRYTGFSETTIRAAIKAGKFTAYRVEITGAGRKENVRIRRESLDAWIEGQEQDADGKGEES